MNKAFPYILSLISSVFFALSWNITIPAFSLFFAFIPILFLIEIKSIHYTRIFNLSLFSFLGFHFGTVWWLSESSIPGFLVIILLNSFFMAIVVLLNFLTYRKFGKYVGLFSFIIYWMSFEYIHYRWELSWPFMNLGNWLGQMPRLIQWYEYTGVLGGTLWILVINMVLFLFIKMLIRKDLKLTLLTILLALIFIIVPIHVSNSIYQNYKENGSLERVKIIQPNINPYKEKYNTELYKQQIETQINLAFKNETSQIDCYIFPESSFPIYLNENSISNNNLFQRLDSLKNTTKNTCILGGLYSYRVNEMDTIFYNTAFMLNKKIDTYHKSKLVIGVEKMPFQDYVSFLKNWNLNFGGFNNSLTADNQRKVFYGSDSVLSIAPIICYESVYGQFVSDFIKAGAKSIAVITNDGWWGDTPGYKQHLMHSQIRAIETRKSVARAANTGISCFIDQRGNIVSQCKPWEQNSLVGSLYCNSIVTFYAQNGDYLGKLSIFASIFIIFFSIYLKIKNRNNTPFLR